ncbi:CLUMA_CG016252, isoform A [Clunio marinus]|uniref:CLUMA_CG016252, isoform A n=1 Tax=Clunio marinus TaxID=568069 RepID=A0A1J1IUH7_9DIPT|nr:CLUMA_CG016252, isoform A [Clunio marinus]
MKILIVGVLLIFISLDTVKAGGDPTDICLLPQVVGPCRGAFQRWYYDATTQECSIFIYGGCLGNANNFSTEEECYGTCCTEVSDESSPPMSASAKN